MENNSTVSEEDVQNKGGCRKLLSGCFKFGIISIALIIVLGFALTPVLRSLGIIRPDVRELYGGAPDIAASNDITQVFLDLNITGVTGVVIPSQQGGQAAIVIMDAAKGFGGFSGPSFDNVLQGIIGANSSGDYGINYYSFVYLDEEGNELFTMATDQASLQGYAIGSITRAELMGNTGLDVGSFLDALDFSGDLGN
ncbi:MAG: hypothetical protein N2C13_02050 [Chloroflexota bacterium]